MSARHRRDRQTSRTGPQAPPKGWQGGASAQTHERSRHCRPPGLWPGDRRILRQSKEKSPRCPRARIVVAARAPVNTHPAGHALSGRGDDRAAQATRDGQVSVLAESRARAIADATAAVRKQRRGSCLGQHVPVPSSCSWPRYASSGSAAADPAVTTDVLATGPPSKSSDSPSSGAGATTLDHTSSERAASPGRSSHEIRAAPRCRRGDIECDCRKGDAVGATGGIAPRPAMASETPATWRRLGRSPSATTANGIVNTD